MRWSAESSSWSSSWCALRETKSFIIFPAHSIKGRQCTQHQTDQTQTFKCAKRLLTSEIPPLRLLCPDVYDLMPFLSAIKSVHCFIVYFYRIIRQVRSVWLIYVTHALSAVMWSLWWIYLIDNIQIVHKHTSSEYIIRHTFATRLDPNMIHDILWVIISDFRCWLNYIYEKERAPSEGQVHDVITQLYWIYDSQTIPRCNNPYKVQIHIPKKTMQKLLRWLFDPLWVPNTHFRNSFFVAKSSSVTTIRTSRRHMK